MKKFRILTLFCLVAGAASAQDFLVYSFKGNVSIVESGKPEIKALIGKQLKPNQSVKIAAGGSATLICNEAAMFTLSKPGTYALNKFGDSCKVSSSSVTANYVKYVWASMTKTSGSASSNRKQYMNTVGAVTRGLPNVWLEPRLNLDTVYFAGVPGDFPLSWKSYPEAKEFEFTLYAADNLTTPVYTTTTGKTRLQLSDIISKLSPGKSYFWNVVIKGETSEDMYALHYVTKEQYNALLAEIKASAAAGESPAAEAYRTGFILEEARYYAEAYQYYTKAAQLDKTIEMYKTTLSSFKKDYEIK